MKIITRFQTDDGKEFKTEQECIDYEKLCSEIRNLMKRLPEKPESCDFQNGEGYIQHEENLYMEVRTSLLKIAQRFTEHHWLQESIDKGFGCHASYASRIISECCPDPVYEAWYRILCTTNDLREFGQPYYADHPSEAEGTVLN